MSEREAGYVFDGIQPATRDVVWTFMTDPAIRPRWQAGVTRVNELPTAPRRGVGTTNHCMHGSEVLIEEILDWRPSDYLTLRTTLPNGLKVMTSYTYEDVPDGTRVRLLFSWARTRREREAMAPVRDFIADVVERGQAALHDLLVEEMARRSQLAADEPPEPVAPGSLDRELLEPVTR